MAETLGFLPQQTQHPAFNAVESRKSGSGEKGGPSPPFWLNVARPEEASEQINAWIEDETEERIKDLVKPDFLDPSTRLVLANAVYFKAWWLSSFEESSTREGPFTLLDGGEVTVPLMRQTSYLPYAEGGGYQAVRLPEEGRFEEIEGRLSASFLDEGDAEIRPDEFLKLTMPRFDFETDLDLIRSLTSMGMTVPFGSGADFAGITEEAPLSIGDALHRANITVDERGTEAAAATVLGFPTSAQPQPVEITANRPSIFAITERETGTILFLGRVTDPS